VVKAAPLGLVVPVPDRSSIERVGCRGTGDNCRVGILKDLPKAEMHRLNSGHFAVEDCLLTIVDKMKDFYRRARAA
jgi:hypothetical protein